VPGSVGAALPGGWLEAEQVEGVGELDDVPVVGDELPAVGGQPLLHCPDLGQRAAQQGGRVSKRGDDALPHRRIAAALGLPVGTGTRTR